MNFLAHAYLSNHQPPIITGNMIADFVKGRQWMEYTAGIQQGIRLHRLIDSYTDTHPATLEAKKLFQPTLGKYSAVFIDIVYDHFLATDRNRFPGDELAGFAQEVYSIIQAQSQLLPPRFREMFRYMREQNWLYGYSTRDGMFQTFSGMVRRSRYLDVDAAVPFAVFETHYDDFAASYQTFFPDLVNFVQNVTPDITSV